MRDENKEVFVPVADLRESTPDELRAVIAETKQKLLEIREQNSYGRKFEPPKPHLIREYKKLIARCETLLREKTGP